MDFKRKNKRERFDGQSVKNKNRQSILSDGCDQKELFAHILSDRDEEKSDPCQCNQHGYHPHQKGAVREGIGI